MSSDTDAARQESERQKTLDSIEQWLFSEREWSITHALFWAATRDRKGMARYFAPGPGQAFEAAFSEGKIFTLSQWLKRMYPHPLWAKIEDIENAARHGRIEISGLEDGQSPRRAIPAGDWAGGAYRGGLEILDDPPRYPGPYAARRDQVPHRKVWTDLRVLRAQVMSVFRADKDLPDIFAEDHWNFAMAVAWICWRSEKAVREVWPRWPELQSLDPCIATVFRLRNPIDNVTAPPAISIDDAIRDLLSRLRKGEIGASFRGERIPPERWGFLTHEGYLDGPHCAGANSSFAGDWEILILRSEILELWREMSPADTVTGPHQHNQVHETPANPLHVLIREVADRLNTSNGPPAIRAQKFRDKIRAAVKEEGAEAPADSTIKQALKGTKHMRSPKRKTSAAKSRDQP